MPATAREDLQEASATLVTLRRTLKDSIHGDDFAPLEKMLEKIDGAIGRAAFTIEHAHGAILKAGDAL